MVTVETPLILSLLTVAILAYCIASLVPRVDAMEASYRKFLALTTLGLSYLVLLVLLAAIVGDGVPSDPVGSVLAMAVVAFVLFGLTLLYDVFDDWIRLFGDPRYNTWVEASLVLAIVVVLVVFFVLGPA